MISDITATQRFLKVFTTFQFDNRMVTITFNKSVEMVLCILLGITVLPTVIAEAVATENTPPTSPFSAATPQELLEYSRFQANDSLTGLAVPCTYDEKVCFRYNLLFDVKGDHCRPIGYGHHCHLRVNRTEFEHGSGHVVGMCEEFNDPCPGYRMAYDGRCHRKEEVRDVICGCDAEPAPHFLGGMECRCTPPTPIHVEQPEEEGHCRIPDFRFPDYNENSTRYENWVDYHKLNCSSENFKCFSEEKVWVPEGNGCFKVLERGPCAEDHIVVLDSVAAREEGRAEASCAPEGGGCPHHHVRMAFDGQCYAKRDIQLIVSKWLDTNVFGETTAFSNGFKMRTSDPNICWLLPTHVSPGFSSSGNPNPPCGSNDKSQCTHFEVESEIPKPV